MSAGRLAAIIGGTAVVSAALAVATWGDGDPGPWIWISFVAAPLGVVVGGVALARGGGRTALAALVASAVVSAVWLFVLVSLAAGS